MLPCCADEFCENKLLEDIKYKPYEVFLNDVMFLLCRECKLFWMPRYCEPYEIHPTSPLTVDLRHFLRKNFRKIYARLEIDWFYASKKVGNSDAEVIESWNKELGGRCEIMYSSLTEYDAHKLFHVIVNTALICIVCETSGVEDALTSGVTAMSEVFKKYYQDSGCSDSTLSRISSLIPLFPVDNWSSNTTNESYNVFVRDLLTFLCCFPIKTIRVITPNSPFSINVQRFIKKAKLKPSVTYDFLHNAYSTEEYISKAFFYGQLRITEEISSARIPQVKSAEDLLILTLKVVITCVEFRNCARREILFQIQQLLCEALNQCNKTNKGRIFYLFDAYASFYLTQKYTILDKKYFRTHYFVL